MEKKKRKMVGFEAKTGRKDRLEKMIGLFILFAAIAFFAFRGVNEISNTVISYDEAYNATVSANLERYGEYRVSYPSDIKFYNKITTGQTVLVPTAVLYYIFGIDDFTSGIVPLAYGIGCFVLLFILLCELLKDNEFKHIISAVMVMVLFLSDFYFFYCSTRLIGEIAALFFVLISALGIVLYNKKNNNIYMLISGAAIIATYLTKSSMIFILVTFWGLIFIATFLEKKIEKRAFVFFGIGNVASFFLLDLIKLFQLGSLQNYFKWYKDEWLNMMDQSSGIDMSMTLIEKLDTFQSLLNPNKVVNIILIILPVVVYIISFIANLMKKDNVLKDKMAVVFWGMAGSSLPIYYILLGGSGLNYPRRLSVNTILIKIFWLVFWINIAERFFGLIKKKKNLKYEISCIILSAVIIMIAVFTITPLNVIKESINRYVNEYVSPEYSYGLMQEFLREVNDLPEDSTLYVNGWWQEPDVTLFLNRKMTDISTTDSNTIIRDNSYFLIGQFFTGDLESIMNSWQINLEPIDEIEVDFNRLIVPYANNSYAIYKIN